MPQVSYIACRVSHQTEDNLLPQVQIHHKGIRWRKEMSDLWSQFIVMVLFMALVVSIWFFSALIIYGIVNLALYCYGSAFCFTFMYALGTTLVIGVIKGLFGF